MEIYQLKAFLAVVRTGNLTRAADQLCLTQPAVSRQIKALEEDLGVLLFDRAPGGMVLTHAGKTLAPLAESTLTHAMDLLSASKQLQGEVAGVIRLGTIIDPESIRLGPLLGNLLKYYPLLQVRLQHGISGGIFEQLRAGELDAGFYLGDISDASIHHIVLQTVIYRVIAPFEWAPQLESATWETLAGLPWIGTPRHSSQHRLLRQLMQEHGCTATFSIEADQESSMINLVKNGVGLCLMREELAQAAEKSSEVTVWEGLRQPCSLSFIYRTANTSPVLMQALLQVVSELWAIANPG